MKRSKQNGITLIALVITIIVLLILAGVSIATLTGPNGLLTRANQAKEETQVTREEELRKLGQAEATTHLEEYEYEDLNGQKITIPAKCAVSQVEGENILEDGLVIIDANGNEWVWIDVPRTNEVYITAGIGISNFTIDEYNKIEEDLHIYTNSYRASNCTDKYFLDEAVGLKQEEYNNLKRRMLKSIYQKEGFWISRYEAGIEKNRTNKTDIISEDFKPLSSKNKFPLTYVTCVQAQTLASKVAPNDEYISSLMFGIQWDLVLKCLENNGVEKNDLILDSTKWGNYKNAEFMLNRGKYAVNFYDEEANAEIGWDVPFNWNNYDVDEIKYNSILGSKKYQVNNDNFYGIIITTGASDTNKKHNIYDLSGNVWELTLENAGIDFPITCRGGVFYLEGNVHPVSYHRSYEINYASSIVRF